MPGEGRQGVGGGVLQHCSFINGEGKEREKREERKKRKKTCLREVICQREVIDIALVRVRELCSDTEIKGEGREGGRGVEAASGSITDQ